ncbi:MAG: glycine cleavage system protein GcvH [Gammaproteobacteria bacterium]|jgi:glycine cleavage system H protein|nr:glycine cleavage system protein GcvH [Gammaproteobacteria bacterium]
MSEVQAELRYTREHEWLRLEADGSVTIGITDHAQAALGELVYVELPEVGTRYADNEACAVVESVKAASDVYAPLAGAITATNEALADTPELVNSSPYDEGWLLSLQPDDPGVLETMMDAATYQQFVAELED